ncbi:Pre-mRNA-splicing factor cwf18 [Escovopsis weberi]|uniref:Pre-mRNA-splicing factor cwf18 n=1 Tax=Escovopsis weberi TaxID=150374 RepID=A0A0M8MWP7_ESCWE|nr:Pre-mRNA-splicing factor cwf18 [Escovopsis weberi]
MSSHNLLSAASDERKARLAKLKGIKRKLPVDDDDEQPAPPPPSDAAVDVAVAVDADADAAPSQPPPEQETETDVSRLHLSGRNYDPETRGPKLGFEAPPTFGLEAPTLEQQAAEAEARVRQQAAEEAQDDKGIDLFKLQPKKPNWDLKRNMDKKMELLNVRTDNAIARLVRERILGAQAAAAAKNSTTTTTTTATATATTTTTTTSTATIELDGEGAGVDGVALVEGLRVREREEQEEERREREEEEAEEAAAMGS